MGDVNAVYTLECVHRRQFLAARALNERSLSIGRLPFPRTKTIGDVHIDDLVILSVYAISQTCMSIRRPSKCSVPMLCTISLPNAHKCGQVRQHTLGIILGGRLECISGTLGFPLERRVSLMLITMLVAAVGVNRTLLQRLLGGWAFALAFRCSYLSQGLLLCCKRTCERNPLQHSTLRMHLRVVLAAAMHLVTQRLGSPVRQGDPRAP